MELITFKCPEKLAKRLSRLSKRRKISKSDLLRQALENYLTEESPTVSIFSLSEDLCGLLDGPEDLSNNPTYMEGYGK